MKNQSKYLSWIELSERAVKKNIAALSKAAGGKSLAISIKANAYGHGIEEICQLLSKQAAVEYVTVHSLEEAARARAAGWERRIMLLGPFQLNEAADVIELEVEPVIFELQQLKALHQRAAKKKTKVATHLKLETGTNRQGITEDELIKFSEAYKRSEWLQRPYGASTHFANIEDTTNHDYAQFQLNNFSRLISTMRSLGISPKIRHTASSAATILFDKTHFDMVRPGIAAYGCWPSKETYLSYRLLGGKNDLFEPVLSWKTRVTHLKKVAADSFVGYGCTYRTTSPTKLAILPIGYYDGFARELSNQAYVLIDGNRAPVRGRICMNLTMVDISDIKSVKLEDEVVLIGRSGDEAVTAESLASLYHSINYEVLARLSPSTPRMITV